MKISSVLVVCIGNICRSPMAHYLLQQAVGEHIRVSSAGLGALVGNAPDDHVLALMSQRQLDLSSHRARQINAHLIITHDLILVMTQRQKESIEKEFPSARGKVFRFCHWQQADVADPYQQDRAAFEAALTLIDEGVSAWAIRLVP
ncbi:MAG: low molecular weight protein-tyrosine-phosphatase [Moraxellaceae bacterium]|nr:low molecular weight protein-tyrosine-phosphatase [Moraxellaceae bacterium]MDZ4386033.1 low molecular weight protein-tyrosine-phosphatase [Moraxellaceae bacterium]